MMEWPFAPFEALRRDLERIKAAVDSAVPLNPLPLLPGPPGIPRRTGEERAAYGIEPLGTGFTRLLDLLGLAISKGNIGNPIPVGKLVDMKEKAREGLIAAGYSERVIDKALNWYDTWLMRMARIFAPGNAELQRSVVQSAYAEIAPRAEQWMRGMREAFGIKELRVEENLLTSTEHEVLRLAAEGLSNREIAERLFITPGTVRVHLKDIRRAIGVATTEEAVAAFGEPTERERVPISILRLPGVTTIAPYERRAAGLLPLVDEIERSPSMETLGILEDELHDLAGEVTGARALTSGIEAGKFSDLYERLSHTIGDVVLARAAFKSIERETLPMRIEAARRDFLSRLQVMRENLKRIAG